MHARSAATFDISRERALQLFADEGFGQVSLRRLASHMGISTATLYTHVAGKEELLFDALEEHYEHLLLLAERGVRGEPAVRPRVQRLSRALVELYRHCPSRFLLATRERHCLRDGHRRRIDSLRRRIAEQLATWLQGGEALAAGRVLLDLIEHLPLWLAAHGLTAQQQTRLVDALLLGSLPGLRQLPSPEPILPTEVTQHAQLQGRSA
ncbi:TetR/AcrR family transcriptional regulator [Pseudomonas sp.]|jgi:AcrR family transcriptional regulator|uniref:TetR/AcrR family transcriptional regulator n=1 Tax=Pseudomonas sp. TaxID=306 RepID=UPI0006B8F9F1|nr:TetR/AcrR family transcriptional regulator [Pseudomonas sp.]MDT3712035.1 TetR/AcrR family transcriptional regulator [Pseudomonadaceae bacterium]